MILLPTIIEYLVAFFGRLYANWKIYQSFQRDYEKEVRRARKLTDEAYKKAKLPLFKEYFYDYEKPR